MFPSAVYTDSSLDPLGRGGRGSGCWLGGLGGSTGFNDRTHQVSSTGQMIQLSSDTGEIDISATEHPAGASLEGGVNNFENYYFV